MVSLAESVTKSKQWGLWVGSPTDFQRLLRIVENHCESLVPDFVEKDTNHARRFFATTVNNRESLLNEPLFNYPQAQEDREKRLAKLAADIEKETLALEEEERVASQAGRIKLTLTGEENVQQSPVQPLGRRHPSGQNRRNPPTQGPRALGGKQR